MAIRQYIGARYVPIFDGDWDITKDYEPLVIVINAGNSYTSKTYVPHGVDITDTTYWACTGNYNAQVELYRQEVIDLQTQVNDDISDMQTDLSYVKVYITPQMYGAKGDGVTDDYDSIMDAYNAAVSNNLPLLFPKCDGYLINTELVFETPVEIIMDAPIIYKGSNTGLTLGKNGEIWQLKNVTLRLESKNAPADIVDSSVGVHLINFNTCIIKLAEIVNFQYPVIMEGNGAGFAYNVIYTTLVRNGSTLMTLKSDGTGGYFNENLFIGGRFLTNSANKYASNCTAIKLTSGSSYYNDNNNFYGMSMESFTNCIHVDYGVANKFTDIRCEGATNALKVSNASRNNYIINAYGVTKVVNEGSQANNFAMNSGQYSNALKHIIYDSGVIANYSFSNASKLSSDGILAGWNPTAGTITTINSVTKYNGYISGSTKFIGVLVDTSIEKNLNICADSADATFRIGIACFDSSDNLITSGLKGISYDATMKAFYLGGGLPSKDTLNVELPDTCVKAFVFIGQFSKLVSFRISSIKPATVLSSGLPKGLDSIPTCAGLTGDVCINSGSGTSLGWRYDGSSWNVL